MCATHSLSKVNVEICAERVSCSHVSAAKETIAQVFFVWLIATAIGLSHLHHCIVGTVEVLAGYFAGAGISLADFGHFLLWTTLGNAAGGVFFVALVKYSHAIRSEDAEEFEVADEEIREELLDEEE